MTKTMTCGDLVAPANIPADLKRALTVIATFLHPAFDQWGAGGNAKFIMLPGKSKESCILCSATVRDFLYRVGFRDATLLPVVFWIEAHGNDEMTDPLKVLGIGNPEGPQHADGRWDGHLVVTTGGYLIDTTLYQATPRPQWPDFPPMIATKLLDQPGNWFGLDLIAAGGKLKRDDQPRMQWGWLHQPTNTSWREAPDYVQKFRRERVTDLLVKSYRAMSKQGEVA